MSNVDDIYNQITRNTQRRGRSFFPAANVQGQTLNVPDSRYGFRALPPDQNPAYQAAIAKGRPDRSGYTTINLPSGGTASVPIASAQRYLNAFPERPAIAASAIGAPAVVGQNAASIYDPNRAQDITHLQNQLNFPRIYGQGYGNVPAVSAPLNAQERVQRGQSGFGEIASVAAHNIFGVPANQNIIAGLGRNIGSWFGGGNLPSIPPTSNAGVPSPTPFSTPVPSATPTATPFKVADGRSDLLKDTENTFYGGGNAPIPSPTPTPYQPSRLAYNAPRRYSDLGYY